ncbi:alpha/beta fold hydrolase [Kribbella sp. NPDC058693]|uniref:alpha/beta fold hydrolase n=1 Tax=Kribbella sp. NPDC058693 TaxID=3346602 RepID=UPI003655308E
MSSLISSAASRARTRLVAMLAIPVVIASLTPSLSADAAQSGHAPKPTIVLVHGAWADASSWASVIDRLQDDGYTVRAIPNPLRSLPGDAASVRAFLQTLSGPVVLVGHSYGGAVITNAATGLPNIKALVYVNAFALDEGETALQAAGADSALSNPDPTQVFDFVPAGPPTPTTDLYLKRSTVFTSFATGLNAEEKAMVYATQRPGAFGGLADKSGTPAWKTIPSWYLIGTGDKIIPPSVQRAMAKRAGSKVTEFDEGHLGLMSDPKTTTRVIEQAAR